MVVVVIVTALFLTSIEAVRVVQTSSGPVQGRTVSLPYNQSVVQYLGIKYGYAQRFQPCEETHWKTVYNATQPGKPCPQPGTSIQETSEDCLHLNIFVPNIKASNLPVMVLIQDVFYSFNSAHDLVDGSSVSSKGGILVVTYNYRLGAAGFLNAENSTTNLGLRDNIAALTWLRRNILRFGGNPDDVTLVGHSSAAMTVGLLLISPQAKGLFKRAIMMSGSPLSPLATIDQSTATLNSRRIGEHLKCFNMSVLAECIAIKPISDVIKAQQEFKITPTQVPFGPVVDGDVIPDEPEKLFKSKSFRVDSVMVGVMEDDGKILRASLPGLIGNQATDNDVSESAFSDIIRTNEWLGEGTVKKDIIKYMYTDWNNPNNDTTRSHKLDQLYSDSAFNGPVVRLADIISGKSVPTFFYYFTKGAFNTTPSGYTHGNDVRGLFGQSSSKKIMRNVMDLAFNMWMNFVKSGNPSHPNNVKPTWPTYTQNGDYIAIATSINSESKFLPTRMALWNSLLPSLSAEKLENSPIPTIITTTSSHRNEKNCPKKKDSTKALTAVVAVMAIVIIVMLSIIIYQARILSKRQDSTSQNV